MPAYETQGLFYNYKGNSQTPISPICSTLGFLEKCYSTLGIQQSKRLLLSFIVCIHGVNNIPIKFEISFPHPTSCHCLNCIP